MRKLILSFVILVGTVSLISCNYNKTTDTTKPPETNNEQQYNNPSEDGMDEPDYNKEEITLDEAKNIALKHANFKAEQVEFVKTSKEVEGEVTKYEIDFKVGDKEYEYDIDAKTGTIMNSDYDMEKTK